MPILEEDDLNGILDRDLVVALKRVRQCGCLIRLASRDGSAGFYIDGEKFSADEVMKIAEKLAPKLG